MLKVHFSPKPIDKHKIECVIIPVFADQKPLKGAAALIDWRLNTRLSALLANQKFLGLKKEMLLMPSEGRIFAEQILVVGLGKKEQFDEAGINEFIENLALCLSAKKSQGLLLSLSEIIPDRFEWRNSVRLLTSKLGRCQNLESIYFVEPDSCVADAKKRQMDFGPNIDVFFDSSPL